MKRLVTLFLILMLLCGTAMADNGTVITMDTTNVPEIPEGTLSAEVIPFTGNQTYAVFSAPTKKSMDFMLPSALMKALRGRFSVLLRLQSRRRNTIPALPARLLLWMKLMRSPRVICRRFKRRMG